MHGGKVRMRKAGPGLRAVHGEGVAAALKMVVAEDGASHNGQIRVAAKHIMRELTDEIQQQVKRAPADGHGHMPLVEGDAVLGIIAVRGVLQPPRLAAQRQRQRAERFMGRIAGTARISFVFQA